MLKIGVHSGHQTSIFLEEFNENLVIVKKIWDQQKAQEIWALRVFAGKKHKNIVNVLKIKENSGEIVFELCERGDLEDFLRNNELSTLEIQFLFKEIAKGLRSIHKRGVIHRDIKPKNLYLKRKRVKIGDFGEAFTGKTVEDGDVEEYTQYFQQKPRFCQYSGSC